MKVADQALVCGLFSKNNPALPAAYLTRLYEVLYLFSTVMRVTSVSLMRTKADQLRHSIAFALGRPKIQGRKGVLSEQDRYAIADEVVARLREHGDHWRLDEELPLFFHGPGHMPGPR